MSTFIPKSWLACPNCHGALEIKAELLNCRPCQRDWPVREGVPDFTTSATRAERNKFDAYASALANLPEKARQHDWLHALREIVLPLPEVGRNLFSYVTDESKGDLTFVMNIQPGHTVVDLGCGLGAVTAAIARRGATCIALDISHAQATFSAIRCHQLGFDTVYPIAAGDELRLPIANQALDSVVMNGVLEWVGCAEGFDGTPEEGQLALLRDVHRVLKPGGQVYLATKNLYALIHFLGTAPDHCTQLRWFGLLPIKLQRLLAKGRRADSGARIYGLRGYERLFARAGFRISEKYALLPNFRTPRRIVPISDRSILGLSGREAREAFDRRVERLVAQFLPARLFSRLVYCYGFLLERST